ncbi:DEAD/DEAH box helicase [Solimicrobium silvestre]|uniref:ATP-dependent RNA helicase DeaD n=1 Tax=Solimicrobium silvestre TaxID=2099400 RepID=A0A2S9H290_9BURK|nr:DEAD/DEAH box helicase [Solimicrobium silvestre]PRC94105.1 DEAD/DEAH box helicase [Solimicrobium silvestre]
MSENSLPSFSELELSDALLRVLNDIGYETPSPIQAATIPLLLANRDVLGQAQTGTGKTAAFALPILSRIDIKQTSPQALVLAPTRELAIQVAEAFQSYATHIPGFHVLPIYGGQSYGPQLSALRRGVHVVVGTPGRVIDHLDKGTLDLSKLKTLVLDEADEMLRMGFIDDVERILKETPESRQTTLFSATMPSAIKRIAQTYLKSPEVITVAAKTGTADNIRQRYWLVSGMHKLDALTRILEAETFDGMIIFARTKLGTEELAGRLQARGFSAAAINGDIQQAQRERTIAQLKDGKIDILVATDVAARGLDVERISHVINYDVPHDPESYTHRIGRTGRAGRSGEAILFITPREKGLLKIIERSTRQPISPLELPSVQAVNDVRIAKFKDQINATIAEGELEQFQAIIEDFEREHNVPAIEIAAALAKIARGDVPLLLDKNKREPRMETMRSDDRPARNDRNDRGDRGDRNDRFERAERPQRERGDRFERSERPARAERERGPRVSEPGMQTYRIEVGHDHGVKPGNIVGAIANEANIDSKNIGRIEIYDGFSVLDLPSDLPKEVMQHLQSVWVAGQQLKISVDGHSEAAPATVSAPAARERSAPVRSEHKRSEKPAEFAKPFARAEVEVRAEPKPTMQPAEVADPKARVKKDKPNTKSKFAVQSYRIEVGRNHDVTPSTIVATIAAQASLEAKHVGRIDIFDTYSVLDLPEGMPQHILDNLKVVKLGGQQLKISHVGAGLINSDKAAQVAQAAKKKSFVGGDSKFVKDKPARKPK